MTQFKTFLASVLLLMLVTACVPSDLVIVQEAPAEEAIAVVEEPTGPPAAPAELSTATPVEPTATEIPPAATEMPPMVATVPPTVVPTKAPMPALAASNCLICHSDQQTLIDVAAPVEEPEDSLSSGVG